MIFVICDFVILVGKGILFGENVIKKQEKIQQAQDVSFRQAQDVSFRQAQDVSFQQAQDAPNIIDNCTLQNGSFFSEIFQIHLYVMFIYCYMENL